ncbi:AraC family transcriptional regulator [Flagellimonas sp. 2504JD4-2]
MQKLTNKRIVHQLNILGYSGCLDFGYYRYNTVEPVLNEHRHEDVMEICYCLKGQQYYQIGDELLKLTGNTILIVPPNVDHSTGVYPEDIGELYWIQVSFNTENSSFCNLPSEQSNYLLHKLNEHGGQLFSGSFHLKNTLERLRELLQTHQSTFEQLQANQLIIQLLVETLLLSEAPQQIADTEKVRVVKSFIESNLHRIIYVDELAALLDFSVPYLKTWFKQNFGVPPRSYINRLKIEKAKESLADKKTITAVAFELGFGSSQYFATTFKKYTGCSPKTYKKSLKQS